MQESLFAGLWNWKTPDGKLNVIMQSRNADMSSTWGKMKVGLDADPTGPTQAARC